jgi:hypothetical protein
MQLIYAAPFILLSLVAFLCSLAIPRFRPYALRALVAPVAFGFCSIVAMVSILLISDSFKLQFAKAPLMGARGVVEGIGIYVLPGLLGACIAVEIVKQIERRVLNSQSRRDRAIRAVTALIVFGPIFVLCTAIQFNLFSKAEDWWPIVLGISLVVAVSAGAGAYLSVRVLQRHMHAESH